MSVEQELVDRVIAWRRRPVLGQVEPKVSNEDKQFQSMVEEVGEYFDSIRPGSSEPTDDAIGDVMVTAIVLIDLQGKEVNWQAPKMDAEEDLFVILGKLAHRLRKKRGPEEVSKWAHQVLWWAMGAARRQGLDAWDCLRMATEMIESREAEGQQIGGTFLKKSDIAKMNRQSPQAGFD